MLLQVSVVSFYKTKHAVSFIYFVCDVRPADISVDLIIIIINFFKILIK